jgi:hypothetical protein
MCGKVGVRVSWNKTNRKWEASLMHDRKDQYLGRFDYEHEAARAVDTAVRRLQGEDAHGGRAERNQLKGTRPGCG